MEVDEVCFLSASSSPVRGGSAMSSAGTIPPVPRTGGTDKRRRSRDLELKSWPNWDVPECYFGHRLYSHCGLSVLIPFLLFFSIPFHFLILITFPAAKANVTLGLRLLMWRKRAMSSAGQDIGIIPCRPKLLDVHMW